MQNELSCGVVADDRQQSEVIATEETTEVRASLEPSAKTGSLRSKVKKNDVYLGTLLG